MKRILFILTLAGAVAALSSCDKWLDLKPTEGVIETEYWTSKEEVHAAVIGCYTSLMTNELIRKIFYWGELRGDMVTIGPTSVSTLLNITRGEISPDNGSVSWGEFYSTINQCNKVIENAAVVRNYDQSFTDRLYRQYVAEATTIRTLMYFYLVRSFRAVPFVLEASDNDEQDYYVAKTEGEIILDSLATQLRRVIDGLPVEYSDNASSKGRFTHYGCMALLADILLWQEKNDECAILCQQIMNSGKYMLVPVDRGEPLEIKDRAGTVLDTAYIVVRAEMDRWFDELYVKGNSVESIFEIQFPETHPSFIDPFYWLFNSSSNSPRLSPSEDNLEAVLFPPYEHTSVVEDIRTYTYQKTYYIWKYTGLGLSLPDLRTERTYPKLIVYRLADIMLMRAEALATNISATEEMRAEAYKLVQEVRARSNAIETDESDLPTPIDPRSLEKLILNERGRELVFEAKRWYDVLRFAKRNNYGDGSGYDYLTTMAVYSAPPEKVASLQVKYRASEWFHYWPIATDEIERNKNLEQNEFYILNQ